jgi:hypothetical protein
MCHQRPAVPFNVLEDWFESWIIRQDVMAVSIIQFHANVFPNLYRHGSLREIPVELSDRNAREICLAELEGVEARAKRSVTLALVDDAQRILQLRLHGLSIGIMIVYQKDVQNVHVQARQHRVEAPVAFGHVGVGIDRLERCKSL